MASPYRRPSLKGSRQASTDPREDLSLHMDYYIGIDVGTGSARACIVDAKGDIVGLASENIGLWQPEHGYYVGQSLTSSHGNSLTFVVRSNPLPIYGAAFASLYSELSVSTTLAPIQFAALVSMPLALCQFSTMKPMSLSR